LLLSGSKVTKKFGGLYALKDVDFEVRKGEIVGLIGPNGSGKTTLFNVISGIYNLDGGKIFFDGVDISKFPAHMRCKLGIGRTFQIVRPFNEMSLIDNVKVGLFFSSRRNLNPREVEKEALTLLEFVGLKEKAHFNAMDLTLMEKKKLEIARAMATQPRILLLDEPLSGLNTAEVLEAVKLILRIRDEFNISIFWVEHIMGAIMRAAERVIVLNNGEKIAEGTPEEISKDENVIKVYLGERYLKRGAL
jgi:branched-chain amino acid transport system ATP-binding protein